METEYPQSPHIEKHNVVMEKTMVPFVKPESTISVVTGKNATPISIDLEHSQSYFYLPGEVIHGKKKRKRKNYTCLLTIFFFIIIFIKVLLLLDTPIRVKEK